MLPDAGTVLGEPLAQSMVALEPVGLTDIGRRLGVAAAVLGLVPGKRRRQERQRASSGRPRAVFSASVMVRARGSGRF